ETATQVAAELKKIGLSPADGAKRLASRIGECESLDKSRGTLAARVAALEKQAIEAAGRLEEAKRAMAALGWDPARIAGLRLLEARLSKEKLELTAVTALAAAAEEVAKLVGTAPPDAAVLARRA